MNINKDLKKAVEEIVKANLLLHVVFEGDEMELCEAPYLVDINKYNSFLKAIEILSGLKEKGECDFTVEDINKEYTMHAIYVTWKLTDNFYMCIDEANKKGIKMLLDCVDECVIRDDEANVWQLSSEIYIPTRKIEEV